MKKDWSVSYEDFESWKQLAEDDRLLVQAAYEVCENAYAPYSNFKVGASLKMSDGKIITGSNQENVAFPSGLCAERVALFYAGSNFPHLQVNTLCIVAKGPFASPDKLLSPCGACRQVIAQSEDRQENDLRVILVSQNERTMVFTSAKDLLPFAFI